MRRSHIETEPPGIGANLTPLIDVVFILLIFFVVNTSFVRDTGIDLQRPGAASAAMLAADGIRLVIDGQGRLFLQGQAVPRRLLRARLDRLHHAGETAALVIVADRRTSTGLLVEVMDQARLAGLERIALAAAHEPGLSP